MSTALIDLETAAKRSGKSLGQLRRVAATKWAAAGLAKLCPSPKGGKPCWFVDETADPAFARVKQPEHISVDLRQFTADQRDEASRRLALLNEWEEFCSHSFKIGYGLVRATHSFCEKKLLATPSVKVSARTLRYWHNAYRAGGFGGLIDRRGGDQSSKDDGPDLFLAEVQRLYLSLRQPKLTTCLRIAELTAGEQGWPVRNYKACQRHIDQLPAALIVKMRGGEDAYVAKAETYIERDYTSIDSNDAWCADHHQMDVIVNSGGNLVRPWLSVWQDVRSRKIVGWVLVDHDPSTDTILSCFRAGVVANGVPKAIYIDNGKDYDSKALNGRTKRDRWVSTKIKIVLDADRSAGVFPSLGITVNHVWPYHGQSKPVERWFANPEDANRLWPTYCGNSTANKPEDLQLQLERGKAPAFADYVAWFADWLTAHDAGHKHSGQGMDGQTPDQAYAENLHTKRTAPADLLDLLCMPRIGPVKVGRNGVTHKGLRYGQFEPALQRLLGADVILRVDERDVRAVHVYDVKDRFICVAPSNEKLAWGADSQDLRDAIKSKRQDRKLLNTYVDRRPRMSDDLPDRIVRAKAAQAAEVAAEGRTPPPSPNISPIQHPMADALPFVKRALDRQKQSIAVGAESTQLVDVAKFLAAPEPLAAVDPFMALTAKFRGQTDE